MDGWLVLLGVCMGKHVFELAPKLVALIDELKARDPKDGEERTVHQLTHPSTIQDDDRLRIPHLSVCVCVCEDL